MGRRLRTLKCKERTQGSCHSTHQVPRDLYWKQKTMERNSFVRPPWNWKNLLGQSLCHWGWRNFLLCLILRSHEQVRRRKWKTDQTTLPSRKVLLKNNSEKRNPQSSSSMKSTPCAVVDPTEKTRLQEESRPNSWSRCKAWAMTTLEYSS